MPAGSAAMLAIAGRVNADALGKPLDQLRDAFGKLERKVA